MNKMLIAAMAAGLCASCNMKWPKVNLGVDKVLKEEKPESMVQNHIASVLRATDDVRYFKEMASLMEVARDVGWDNRRLLEEVVAYNGRLSSDAEQLTRYYRLLETLHIPRATIVTVAAPALDSRSGATQVGRELLRWAAPPDSRGRADFSHFAQYLEVRQQQPPAHLVLWMYDRNPGAALWEMSGVYGGQMDASTRNELLQAEHAISEGLWRQQNNPLPGGTFDPAVPQQIQKLAAFKQWWVRAYVAQILFKNPTLRHPEIVERLKQDESPIVRAALGA